MDVLVDELDPTDKTGWWNRTRWVVYLEKSNLKHLAHAARLPGTGEPELKVVADSVDQLIEDCVKGLDFARLEEEAVSVSEEDGDDVAGPIVKEDRMRDARRLFPWTDETRDKARTILHTVACRRGAKDSILVFSRSIIMQHVSGSNFVNPTIYFMAILGINLEHGTLREAQDYSYMLTGLVYCVRVINLELLLPSKNGDSEGIPEIHNFFVERKKYLQDGSMGVLPCMISLLAYGKNIAMDYCC
ncbi:hypothetical protein E4U61_006305 [Claviceps capensis]|nr:hypothetical protein E4U61_006305 [Claviceps capensis]